MHVLDQALEMLERHPLCDDCLGRQFALLGHGLENDQRGRAIKTTIVQMTDALGKDGADERSRVLDALAANGFYEQTRHSTPRLPDRSDGRSRLPMTCYLCENRSQHIHKLVHVALEKVKDYEHNSFLVGVSLPTEIKEREDEFKAEFRVNYGESLQSEFARVIGKEIRRFTGKVVDHRRPEIAIVVDPFTEDIKLNVNPLYIAGRYQKLLRGLSQSRWFCPHCRGEGCKTCDGTGRMYPESVEEIISKPFLELTGGVAEAFHASGREDIDVRMLGNGRPFVVEIKRPKNRFLDLKKLREITNKHANGKVVVSGLRYADKAAVRKLKRGESSRKEYRVIVRFRNHILNSHLSLLRKRLRNTMIRQRTPRRVLHRRADIVREKYIYDVKAKKLSLKRAEIRILCQGGLYVKELVTGDDGRTELSISEILGNKAEPIELDVLNVVM